jgi:hypothetical protein
MNVLTLIKINLTFFFESQLTNGCPAALADSQLMMAHDIDVVEVIEVVGVGVVSSFFRHDLIHVVSSFFRHDLLHVSDMVDSMLPKHN